MLVLLLSFLLCMGCFVSCDNTPGLKQDANTSITESTCPETEREALLFFKANLVDINNNLHDWGSQEEQRDCCRWTGVYCNYTTSHVITLDLSSLSDGLSGKISPYLPVLHQLQYLDLSGIDFQFNPIPSFLGSLPNLRHLDISASNLSGRIPFPFGDLTSLTYLDLSKNHLNGSLPNFSGYSSLTKLSLAHNFFNGSIPDFIGCRSLQELDLSSNRLSGNLPKSVGQLSNLEYLDVSFNNFSSIISDVHFLNLTQLTYLDISLAFELSSHGSIPSQLETIKLQSCKLGPNIDGIPAWFWNLPSGLKFLDLSSNELKGMLPNTTSNFDGYPGMDLSYNQLEGRIPLLPSKLSSINLSGNRLSGNLFFLCEIDEELTFLDLSNNLLSGRLPDCWLRFQKRMVVLNLSNNTLSGEIPSSLGFLSQLEALYLRSNAFVGELPISLSNCTKLRFVDFGVNNLSGIIPTWIGERLSNLSFLVLRSNSFYGRLPSQLCWLNNLQVLHLSKNGFSGNIPRCFGNFTAMANITMGGDITNHSYYSFYLHKRNPVSTNPYSQAALLLDVVGSTGGSYAAAEGPYYKLTAAGSYVDIDIYEEAVFLDSVLVAWKGKEPLIFQTTLSGKLPNEITSLHGLVSLNLSINKLQGELPKHMGQLKSLDALDLSGNEFSGNIPSSLSEISSLGYLNLSNNKLSGRIPTGPQLQLFDCSSYIGNPYLYGPPLTPGVCGIPPTPVVGKEHNEEEEMMEVSYGSHITLAWLLDLLLDFGGFVLHIFQPPIQTFPICFFGSHQRLDIRDSCFALSKTSKNL
ncbi:LOW QUALITY PROTEIN: hypothetical protein OSB04_026918 [Centaurea solstitialis]|uniref:Leucine-rich repeat-containing N-terminal plant-type domain-containing protein n=1 Tax=Centaurea solstitialis TaxID=347529 RepID=A0AA38VW49_9ASTR|nr:LOW QUALITY PROTEIN: hypothetical protein OSB04_026918 [Centaurea solstitialis]